MRKNYSLLNGRIYTIFIFVVFFLSQGIVWGQQWETASIQNLPGNWEGDLNIPIPRDTSAYIPASSIKCIFSLDYTKDSSDVFFIMNVDVDKFLTDWANVNEVRRRGLKKNDLWKSIADQFRSGKKGITVGKNFNLLYNMSLPANEFFINNSLQIDEQGNKMKIIFPEPISFGLGDKGFNEIFLDKK
ncbi:MAG: hypothetical protein FWC19_04765 [Treponema sp.]|nr:hypothetical protein [Treponema sp.]MCL2272101.1 hypothetical protein [Treponema sp.]